MAVWRVGGVHVLFIHVIFLFHVKIHAIVMVDQGDERFMLLPLSVEVERVDDSIKFYSFREIHLSFKGN